MFAHIHLVNNQTKTYLNYLNGDDVLLSHIKIVS